MGREEKIKELDKQWESYRYNRYLTVDGVPTREKTMTPLIAATGVGKSTLTTEILRLADTYGISAAEAGTETTRPHRPDDGPTYRTDVPFDEMVARIENREYTNWSTTPSGHIYATPYESLTAKHNFLPCLPKSYEMLKNAGFKALNAFYIVTPAEAWLDQIEDRVGLKDFPGRITEALSSLEYARKTGDIHKIVSQPGTRNMSHLALKILDYVKLEKREQIGKFHNSEYGVDFERHSREMYSLAIKLSQGFNEPA